MRKRSALAVVTLVVLLVGAAASVGLLRPSRASAVEAQSAITLTIQGLTPAGQPINLQSYSWSLSNPVGGTPAQQLKLSDLVVTKQLDTLSPAIVQAIKSEQGFASGTLLITPADPTTQPTFRYDLSGVTIENASQGGSAEGSSAFISENLSLHANAVNLQTVSP